MSVAGPWSAVRKLQLACPRLGQIRGVWRARGRESKDQLRSPLLINVRISKQTRETLAGSPYFALTYRPLRLMLDYKGKMRSSLAHIFLNRRSDADRVLGLTAALDLNCMLNN